ncbi:HD domain-containing protein [Embleya sp. NPDC008237]|uniref:HD domain-containing protein n=1 Tax=Embleya sp. NPDC008237 TaxID=3363978 RepID=UPI0036ED7888
MPRPATFAPPRRPARHLAAPPKRPSTPVRERSGHAGQVRPAGEPFVEHLLEVVRVLVEALGVVDVDVLRAAILHDVVEDTACAGGGEDRFRLPGRGVGRVGHQAGAG